MNGWRRGTNQYIREKAAVETTVTPTESAQVLEPAAGTEYSKVTVEAIPSNYGRITWNGYALKVE